MNTNHSKLVPIVQVNLEQDSSALILILGHLPSLLHPLFPACCNMFLSDARFYQIGFLLLFLGVGIGTRDWSLHPAIVLTSIGTCLTVQILAHSWLKYAAVRGFVPMESAESGIASTMQSEFQSSEALAYHPLQQPSQTLLQTLLQTLSQTLPSALITALGLSLLLRTDQISTMVIAATAAILSKFVLRVQGKHLFNPANFGIITALTFCQNAWVSPGQWGEEAWYVLLFLVTGGLVLRVVGRWDITIAFLGNYAGLEAVRNLWLGWTWDVWLHRLMSGSLLMFACFMITDPRTIPNARCSRLIWATAIALLTFILRNYFYLSTAAFWSLFFLTPLTIALNHYFPAAAFVWKDTESSEQNQQSFIHSSSES